MHFSRRAILLGTVSLLLLAAPSVHAQGEAVNDGATTPTTQVANTSGPQNFVDTVAKRGISFLADDKLSPAQQRQSFRTLLRDSFDLSTIGRFVLGRYWRVATASERAEYQRLFERMVIDVYAERFSTYNGQTLKTTTAKAVNDTDTIVSSLIVPKEGGEKVKVDWRIRGSGARYRVVDVIVEGVSMSVTQRADFAAVIQRGGGEVSALLKHMRTGNDPATP